MAQVDRQVGLAGYRRDDRRPQRELAGGAYPAGLTGDRFDRQSRLRRRQSQRRGASPIGVVPACEVCPRNVQPSRSTPAQPETAAQETPSASSTGPCSMWSST